LDWSLPASGAPSGRRTPLRNGRSWLVALLCWLIAMNPLLALVAHADSYDERRVRTGARLFRSLLAADTGLDRKAGPDGGLVVWVYSTDNRLGQDVLALLNPPGDPAKALVRGHGLQVRIIDRLPAATDTQGTPMSLFLASPPPVTALPALVRWSVTARCILFSPFEGHVEQGVTAGLAIEAKVQPFLNRQSLEASGLVLKPFFLKVAKVHP
jgi:hypothetical protein